MSYMPNYTLRVTGEGPGALSVDVHIAPGDTVRLVDRNDEIVAVLEYHQARKGKKVVETRKEREEEIQRVIAFTEARMRKELAK